MAWIIADAHVHLFPGQELGAVAGAAMKNFRAQEKAQGWTGEVVRYLCLAETAGHDFFGQHMLEVKQAPKAGKQLLLRTSEENSLRLNNPLEPPLFFIAGRQIVSSEGLEILALGLREPYQDHRPIERVVTDLMSKDVILVLPWGVGKWLGKRGRVVQELMARYGGQTLFLGDNGNRPAFWPLPPIFGEWGSRRNLPGTDPLQLRGQEHRAGSFGLYTQGNMDYGRPYFSLLTLLTSEHARLHPYGPPQKVIPFFHSQFALRWKRS